MIRKRRVIFGVICLILCITGIFMGEFVYSYYSPMWWWRLLYSLCVFCGIGGLCSALVFFGSLLDGKRD